MIEDKLTPHRYNIIGIMNIDKVIPIPSELSCGFSKYLTLSSFHLSYIPNERIELNISSNNFLNGDNFNMVIYR